MLQAISSFDNSLLRPTVTTEKHLADHLSLKDSPPSAVVEELTTPRQLEILRREAHWAGQLSRAGRGDVRLTAPLDAMHGRCFGFEEERKTWRAPLLTSQSAVEARPGYNSMSKSEYHDDEATLQAKMKQLARLIRQAHRPVVFAGAGLSTAAGIGDYASQPPQTALKQGLAAALGAKQAGSGSYRSPLCAQPTLSHRVLAAMHKEGHLHRLVQQNHDGLPQKAGLPQEALNEIHGACHAPDNPVVPMSGALRDDLFADLLECEKTCDLALALGTSLCGMNADRVIATPAAKAARGQALGSVIIGLQRTVVDDTATLRIFGILDDVLSRLAQELQLQVEPPRAEGSFFRPAVLCRAMPAGSSEDACYLLKDLQYDAAGARLEPSRPAGKLSLDLREGAKLVIPSGMHAGATGEVDGYDREGNPRCRFHVRLKRDGTFKASHPMLLGTWWLQAAADAAVPLLPVVNEPDPDDHSQTANQIRAIRDAY